MNPGDAVLRLRPGNLDPVPAIVIRVAPELIKVRDTESGRVRSVHPRWVVLA